MTTIKHVYAIKETLQAGNPTDSFPYSNSLIVHFMEIARSTLIEQKANKYHHIAEQNFQTWCADLEKSSFHNCCTDVNIPCSILRSVEKIPRTISTRWGDLTKVMFYDGRVIPKISKTSDDLAKYSRSNTEDVIGWFIHDNYLYIQNSFDLKAVLVSSLFADPESLLNKNCNSSDATRCENYLESIFPIDPELVAPMYTIVQHELIKYAREQQVQPQAQQ